MNIVRAGEPLFDALIAAGRIRPDPLRIGLDVDWDCRVLGADGAPVPDPVGDRPGDARHLLGERRGAGHPGAGGPGGEAAGSR